MSGLALSKGTWGLRDFGFWDPKGFAFWGEPRAWGFLGRRASDCVSRVDV